MRRRLSGRVSEVRYTFDKAEMTIDDALEHARMRILPFAVFMNPAVFLRC